MAEERSLVVFFYHRGQRENSATTGKVVSRRAWKLIIIAWRKRQVVSRRRPRYFRFRPRIFPGIEPGDIASPSAGDDVRVWTLVDMGGDP